jgi:hypothetical protein
MKNIEISQKISVLHCVYQTIASADGCIVEERDQLAIELALSEVGLSEGNYWDRSIRFNPHDAFIHLSSLTDENKQLFRLLLFEISEMGGNTAFRRSCANHLFQLANCQV